MRSPPIKFSQSLADALCEKLANGTSLRTICNADDFPAVGSVFRWLAENPEFREQYARAREAQADTLADEILDIADDGGNDWMEREEGFKEYNGDSVQRARLRVDARKWIAAKLLPKKYGERQEIELSGSVDIRSWLKELGEPD